MGKSGYFGDEQGYLCLCPLANNFHAACRCILVGFVNFHFGHGGVYSLCHLILPHLLLMSYYGGWTLMRAFSIHYIHQP